MNRESVIRLGVASVMSFFEKSSRSHNNLLNRTIFFYFLGYFYSEWIYTYLLLEQTGFWISYACRKVRSFYRPTIGHHDVLFEETFFDKIVLLPALTWYFLILVLLSRDAALSRKRTSNPLFVFISLNYYISSKGEFEELIKTLLRCYYFRFRCIEDFENIYTPLFLKIISLALSVYLMIRLLRSGYYIPAAYVMGGNVKPVLTSFFSSIGDLVDSYRVTKIIVANYPYVTELELREYDDVCGICLEHMERARTTPCRHYFHTDCLRTLLKGDRDSTCPNCRSLFN